MVEIVERLEEFGDAAMNRGSLMVVVADDANQLPASAGLRPYLGEARLGIEMFAAVLLLCVEPVGSGLDGAESRSGIDYQGVLHQLTAQHQAFPAALAKRVELKLIPGSAS